MQPLAMNEDPEVGTVTVVREPRRPGDCWPALCALATIALLALTCLLVLLPLRTHQEKSRSSEGTMARSQGVNDLEVFMKQVGKAERAKIAAHLIALSSTKEKSVSWQNITDSTFTEGVEFKNNGLVIKTPGHYFVYTQVVFHGWGCQTKATYLSHNISLLSNSYPEENLLLKATKSVCHSGPHQQHWYKTSYQGAIFQFEEGDQIFSRVSERVVQYVDSTQGKTFFGIFAL
ncbi:lymphotoxin-alpha-like [Narcine bancroftii]|uniref:lymphotoxin-alpha-like n=1 Tax=Narcine bancroftii TaxID=1343680 RepID=UPI0038318CA5